MTNLLPLRPAPVEALARGDPNPAAKPSPPVSATRIPTALVGLAAAVSAVALLPHASLPLYQKALIVVAATAAAMAVIDVFVYATPANASAALKPRASRASAERVVRKLIGFWITIGALALAYASFPEYQGDFYSNAWAAADLLFPWLLIASPFYIAWVDRRQTDPEDSYALLGGFFTGRGVPQREILGQHVRGWIVKGFFLPLMFVYLAQNLNSIWAMDLGATIGSFGRFYEFSYNGLFLIDLLFAVVGYLFTLRVLDTHIRSAEPTVTGWVVCLICYQPFWSIIGRNYLQYEGDDFYWGNLTGGEPLLHLAWGILIIAAVAVYASATASFGLRFSNLTHRGIITSGPYRWTKHPAYISKCASFWLISIPLLSNQGLWTALSQSLLLGLACAVYVARAITEERHLAHDPVYREYQAYIREHGVFARLRRTFLPAPVHPV